MNQFADAELDDIQDTCDVLYRRIRRLRKLADGYRKLVKASALGNSDLVYDIRASGARSERARIVAMLRLAAENDPNARCSILDLADEIERGE